LISLRYLIGIELRTKGDDFVGELVDFYFYIDYLGSKDDTTTYDYFD